MSEPTRSAQKVQRHGCGLSASVHAGLASRLQPLQSAAGSQVQIQQVIDLGPLMHATVPHSDNTNTPKPIGPVRPTGHVVTMLGPDKQATIMSPGMGTPI